MIGGDALVVVVDVEMIGNDDDCAAVFEFVEMMISLGWWWFGVVDDNDDDDDDGKSNNDPSESQQLCVIVDRLGIDTTGLLSSLASTNDNDDNIDDEADQSLPLKYLLEWTPYPPSVNRVSDAIRT